MGAAHRLPLPCLQAAPGDPAARGDAPYAAWCCFTALGSVTMGLHHKLAHVLGGSFGLPHAETHAVLLPHGTACNAAAVGDLLAPEAQVFAGGAAAGGLWDFAARLNAPLRLADLGLRAADLDRAADLAVAAPCPNPRPLTRGGIRDLLGRAHAGLRP